jgi:pSer/pThr/pTyr-binding forkhead associated (FHA) protein
MSENKSTSNKKTFSPDWLVRGVLSKIGEAFDRLTGRNWKPSSSLATSELTDRLKKLLDAEVKDLNARGKFVPHNIKLKMQWDKFSTDADDSLKKLEHELLTAAIDHINDRRYHTYAPVQFEIKTDYFTEGIKLQASFDEFGGEAREGELNVSFPSLTNIVVAPLQEKIAETEKEFFVAQFTLNEQRKNIVIAFADGERKSVGRTKNSDLWIDDPSVSKIHAAFVLNQKKRLMVADTGSTNGTFVSGQRIPYGKAVLVNDGEKLKFGTIEVIVVNMENNNDLDTVLEEVSDKTDSSKNIFSDTDNLKQTEQKVILDVGENK